VTGIAVEFRVSRAKFVKVSAAVAKERGLQPLHGIAIVPQIVRRNERFTGPMGLPHVNETNPLLPLRPPLMVCRGCGYIESSSKPNWQVVFAAAQTYKQQLNQADQAMPDGVPARGFVARSLCRSSDTADCRG